MMPTPAPLPTLPSPGSVVDGYLVEELIGRGGMAAVYSARSLSRGNRVALKMLLPQVATNKAVVAMLLDESRIVSRIEHENVARVLHTGNWSGTPYLRLELVDGWSYARIVKRARRVGMRLPLGFHAAVLAQVAFGLAAAHAAAERNGRPLGVVHRDVKPENVLLGFDGRAKLVDFGIARARTRSAKTRPGTLKGTLSYMAPEQFIDSKAVSFRTDLWGLGAMAWECFADRPLFRSQSLGEAMLAVVYGNVPDVGHVCPELPEGLREMIMRCLRRDPDLRPSTATEVANALALTACAWGYGDLARVGAVLATLAEVHAERAGERPSSPPRVVKQTWTAPRGAWLALFAAVLLSSLAASASAAWLVRSHTMGEPPAVRRGASAWRIERPPTTPLTEDDRIPTVDVSDLSSEL